MIRIGLDLGSGTLKAALVQDESRVEVLPPVEILGRPLERVREVLSSLYDRGVGPEVSTGLTASAASSLADLLSLEPIDQTSALVATLNLWHPEVRTVVEMGKQTQKFILLSRDESTGRLVVEDVTMASKCAAGSGSFLEHMARRLNYPSIEEFAEVAFQTENPASLSGRCGVFTESDIVHLYQKGTPRERIAAGIHQALCRNYRSCVSKRNEPRPPVAFIGGVSNNRAVAKYLIQELNLDGDGILVPERNVFLGAIGAALLATQRLDLHGTLQVLREHIGVPLTYARGTRLVLSRSTVMSPDGHGPPPVEIGLAALGVDIGSVSTKAALVTQVDGEVRLLASYYRRTDGDPLSAVRDTIRRIHEQVESQSLRLRKVVAATTGSGRYLTGDYIGADVIRNEITAQATGALAFVPNADSVLEIGGQDSKFIRLSDGVITDFEMNKACAAGTGAFLEKQAANLGLEIEEFGELALRAANPPDLDWQCTVFSESAMVYYQQNNVPTEDLCAGTCLASVKNYLNKNVGNRDTGNVVMFQGAVAFNRGMVAAFETTLGKSIVVPPHPHLTGAIGAAVLAYRASPKSSRFRGFLEIAGGGYEVSSFECTGCPNSCDVNTFQMSGGQKFFYNDRCERFSGAIRQRDDTHLPDLFEEREALLLRFSPTPRDRQAKTVGVPRALLLSDYLPFFCTFFAELGFNVVESGPSNRSLARLGVVKTVAEPCFPVKVAHGHVAAMVERGVDFLFLPSLLQGEQPNAQFPCSQACPYVQALPYVAGSALCLSESSVRVLSPKLYFNRGPESLKLALGELGTKLGRRRDEIEQALEKATKAQADFRQAVEARGREVLKGLAQDQQAFVVIGRPYALYDPAVNMRIGKRIQDLGLLAIPMDFLALDGEDVADAWRNTYWRQVQRKLAAARVVRKDNRLRAVVLTYFGCGPDTFANILFKDEVNEPCYVMQIDEHTADAGVITRIEAFADTVTRKTQTPAQRRLRSEALPLSAARGRKVWVPCPSRSARAFSAALSAYGIEAEPIPRSADDGLSLARRAIPEDVCLPAFMTTEDILLRVTQPDFDPRREAFFQGVAEGPCRYGMYHMLQRRLLDDLGFEDTPIVSLSDRRHDGGMGQSWAFMAWDGMLAHDMLEKMLLHTRPYEVKPGDSEAAYQRSLDEVCAHLRHMRGFLESPGGKWRGLLGMHLKGLTAILRRAQSRFAAIPRRGERRPLVGVIGEVYVRIYWAANQDLVRTLEKLGAEVWLSPITEYLGYSNFMSSYLAAYHFRGSRSLEQLRNVVGSKLLHALAMRDERHLFRATLPYMKDFEESRPAEMVRHGSQYVHPTFGGETICSFGRAEYLIAHGVSGILSAVPFNCMPGMIVDSLTRELRRRHSNVPFLQLDYDGFVDSSRDAKLVSLMARVKERFGGTTHP